MGIQTLRRREAAVLIGVALCLTGCGGGGAWNTKPTVPATTPPVVPPTSPPAAPPATTLPTPPIDAQLSITNTYAAHAAGFTGTGVVIGVVDTGVMRTQPALTGRVTKELVYVDQATNNTAVDDVNGHGTMVSEIAAGRAYGKFAGGIATDATIVSARIIDDKAGDDNGSTAPSQVTSAGPLGQVSSDLIAAGVKVMNNSWGGVSWDASDTSTTKSFHDAYSPFINQYNGLVVFAAGNDGQPNPSTIASLPTLAPDLEKGWLAVVAVNSLHPTQIEDYSNRCGTAMNYCLSAPGDVIVGSKDDTAASQSYYIVEGTSLAAPIVSGAAALVWQAYPYFTNDLVRQTLLGTADPLGGSQPNPTYGYGELDVGKAVNGPEQFNWGDVTVSFSGSSSWNNPISGVGGLIKQGPGTLNLTQPSTFTGMTQVQAGALTAVSLASSVTIAASAVFATTHVSGNINNAGAIAVSGVDATVGGNYAQSGNGRLAVTLGSVLRVGGTATLTGGDLYVFGANQGYVANSHTDVLTAAGGLIGRFTGFTYSPSVTLSATLNYGTNDAYLDVQQVSVNQAQGSTYTASSWGSGERVQSAFNSINNQMAQPGTASPTGAASSSFVSGAAALQQTQTAAALQSSLQSLSGELHAASAQMTFEAIDAGTRALSDRFDQLHSGPGQNLTTGGWAQNIGYQGNMSRNGYGNVGYDLNGWMAGNDFRVGYNGVFGYGLSQSRGLGRLAESADQGTSHAAEGMLYAGLVRDSWYAMGRFGMGDYHENMRRNVQLGDSLSTVDSNNNGSYGVAYGETGYRVQLAGGWKLTPYVDMQYVDIRTDGFQEQGAYGFGLQADSQNIQRWQAGVGMRLAQQWRLSNGTQLSLQGHMLWQQAFAMHGDVLDASFTALQQFAPVGGIGLSRYGGVAGVNLDWTLTPRSSFGLGYDYYAGQFDRSSMAMMSYRLVF